MGCTIAKYVLWCFDKQCYDRFPIYFIVHNILPILPSITWHSMKKHDLIYIGLKYYRYLHLFVKTFGCNLYLTKFKTKLFYDTFELFIRFFEWIFQIAKTTIWCSPSFHNTLWTFSLFIIPQICWLSFLNFWQHQSHYFDGCYGMGNNSIWIQIFSDFWSLYPVKHSWNYIYHLSLLQALTGFWTSMAHLSLL